MRGLALLAVGVVSLSAAASAETQPLRSHPALVWVARGQSSAPLARNRVYLATSYAATKRFRYLLSRPARRRLRAVDFGRYDAIAVFYSNGRVTIVDVGARIRGTVTVTISVGGRAPTCPPGARCPAERFTGYHVVAVPKTRVGRAPVRLLIREQPSALPFATVAQSATVGRRPGAPPVDESSVYLAITTSEAAAFSSLLGDSDQARLAAVDFGRYVVIAMFKVFPSTNHRLEITTIERDGQTLRVSYTPETIGDAGGTAITLCYHVVEIEKALLGDPLPDSVTARAVEAAVPQ